MQVGEFAQVDGGLADLRHEVELDPLGAQVGVVQRKRVAAPAIAAPS